MPIPLIIAGLFAGVVGAGAHITAKEKNEAAQKALKGAEIKFNDAKEKLINSQNEAKAALDKFGETRKTSVYVLKQFIPIFKRIKSGIELKDVYVSNELSNFTFNEQDVLELQEIQLPEVIGAAAVSGTIAAVVGFSFTAIAAPFTLITGFFADKKADENLETARELVEKTEEEIEKMKISKTMFKAIKDASSMYNDLLEKLIQMFIPMTSLLNGVTKKKMGFFGLRKVKEKDLTPQEKDLIRITRSLAGTMKALVDIQMLTKDGSSLVDDNDEKLKAIMKQITTSDFVEQTAKALSYDYGVKAIPIKNKPSD